MLKYNEQVSATDKPEGIWGTSDSLDASTFFRRFDDICSLAVVTSEACWTSKLHRKTTQFNGIDYRTQALYGVLNKEDSLDKVHWSLVIAV